ncbi:MAG: ATP-binding protein [Chitinispirillia bacterium]|nr:ATP-binding protein [Chitinispirillia bacterium]
MKIRRRIFIAMITTTLICNVAFFISALVIYNKEKSQSAHNKVNVAANVVGQEINYLKSIASFAALGIANNKDLVDAISSNDRNEIVSTANTIQSTTLFDYCVIMDKNGVVLIRTNELNNYGDNVSNLPHVKSALSGKTEAYILHGPTIQLAVSAAAPIYDNNMNIIGAVSLGFMLEKQEFVHRLKMITGCEVSIFRYDERISTTILGDDGKYVIGTKADEKIGQIVLSGKSYTGKIKLFGRDIIAGYSPLYGIGDEIVGMLFVGTYAVEDTSKIWLFILLVTVITLFVHMICIILAKFVSKIIEQRMENMMNEIREREMELARINNVNNSQLLTLNLVVKAAKFVLWEIEIEKEDPLNIKNKIIWSDEFNKLLGFENKGDLPAAIDSWIDLVHPDDREKVFDAFSKHLTDLTGKTPYDIEYRMLKKNGEYAYHHAISETIRDKNGNAVHVAGAQTDITEAKNNLLAINKMHGVMKKLLESMDTMLIITEIESDKIIYLNETFKKEFSFTDDAIGRECWKMIVDGAQGRCGFCPKNDLDVNSNKVVSWEFFNPKTQGHYKISSRFMDWPDGSRVFIEQCIDITEIKESIIEINKARDAAEDANRAKSIFLANMSHEIRTPMNSIIGFSELAQYGDIAPKTREYLHNIQESAEWLLKVINDILDISKIESGKVVLERIPFNLTDIFAHCQSAIIPKTKEKGIMLYCYAEPSVGKKLLGDPVRLRQVLNNLLSNAVKFTNVGTVKLLASVDKCDTKNVTIHFEIKDSGIGMDESQIAKIFEPFIQGDDSVTRRFGGTGLGLTITKNIIELMGGTLLVESAIGVGSKFSFKLNFELIDDINNVSEKIMVNEFEKPNFNGDILVCEDNNLNQQVICGHLARVGLNAVVAHNGKEGVDFVSKRIRYGKKPFDLIFMDIHMPVMDGLEAASKITAMGTKTPIVALTANIMSNDLELYRTNGMDDCLGKPFTSKELWKCLVKYIPVESFSDVDVNRLYDEDEKMLNKLKINFVKDNQTAYSKIIEAVEAGDIKTAHRLAHTLKSNAAQIGKKQLQTVAAVVETMLSGEKNLLTEEQIRSLETELKLVLDELKPLLAEARSVKTLEPVDAEKTLALIEKLEPLLKNNDTASLKFLDALYAVPGADEIAQQIEEFEFKHAAVKLTELKKRLTAENG